MSFLVRRPFVHLALERTPPLPASAMVAFVPGAGQELAAELPVRVPPCLLGSNFPNDEAHDGGCRQRGVRLTISLWTWLVDVPLLVKDHA